MDVFLWLLSETVRWCNMCARVQGVASTPPMGVNSWNSFHCNVDERKMRAMADAIVATGLKDAGYEYINIDDCWQVIPVCE